jgi:hypothetical protein
MGIEIESKQVIITTLSSVGGANHNHREIDSHIDVTHYKVSPQKVNLQVMAIHS